MGGRLMQIGEVSERTGLSLRTIRHYEDVGVVAPSERSMGGFRLYTEAEVRRLALVRRMRPLGFCLEDVRALLDVLEQLPDAGGPLPETDEQAYEELVTRLRKYWVQADARCEDLRRELGAAEEFARSLHGHLAQLLDAPVVVSKAAR
ncbi:MerR family transcriptional regulator [Streptomyces halobius]|uniref:MerR family transcriptional regulator n=1 Tax=Streptomyces halobius TaxID=2879846 RepID=A0ABY4MEZ0_9ACTN|nr:MerR family transcriptional regulator [Streptomyces halobius]UQA91942.1 MerR family transcriptional regulator [Streptomyces halobius]UQA96351.1 MerR family transcriptional regulator [Streptomyces halobius]